MSDEKEKVPEVKNRAVRYRKLRQSLAKTETSSQRVTILKEMVDLSISLRDREAIGSAVYANWSVAVDLRSPRTR